MTSSKYSEEKNNTTIHCGASSKSFKACVITVSDSRSTKERIDTAGPALKKLLESSGYEIADTKIVPDDYNEIVRVLEMMIFKYNADLIVTTGGTGISPRDCTPEATRAVINYEIPGLSELMRYSGSKHTKFSYLSRGVAGVRARTIIINVPGSEKGAVESLEAILEILPHAIETVRGDTGECGSKGHEH